MRQKNIDRARRAYTMCCGYPDSVNLSVMGEDFTRKAVRKNCEESEPQDMLTDIMHLCELCGFDFDDIPAFARQNYQAEKNGREED